MYYFAFVVLEHFYVGELVRQRPELAEQTLVLTNDGFVLDASPSAMARGLKVGQSEKQARALIENSLFLPWQGDSFELASREWLDRLIAYSDVIEKVDHHSAFIDLSAHPDPETILMTLAMSLTRDERYKIRVGVGPRRWLAELSANYPVVFSAEENPAETLKPVPISKLLPVSIEARQRLRFLGYPTIGDVQKIPFAALLKQFGREARVITDAAQGGHFVPLTSNYPEQCIRAEFTFDGAVNSQEDIIGALDVLATRLAVLLSDADASGCEFCVIVETEEGERKTFTRVFAKAVYSRVAAAANLRLMVLDEIKEPITSIRVIMPRLAKKKGVQSPMQITSDQQRHENVEAVERVRKTFGDGAIVKASAIQQPWHRRALKIWERCLGHG